MTTFYFYDLETTGFHPFRDRIIQFAGQRLDAKLKDQTDLEEFYLKLSDDILPQPGAILTHRILPQTANLEGLTEQQFVQWLKRHVYGQETIYAGYNIIHFDNPFMRYLHWRNFASAPEMIAPGRSLDIYQLVVLAFDLRPQALRWPKPATGHQRVPLGLEALAAANELETAASHTAGGDVQMTIDLTRRLRANQPKLFQHCLQLLKPDFVKQIINSQQPFIYAHYNHLNTGTRSSLATVLSDHPTRAGCFIAYDLRADCRPWQKLSAYELSLRLQRPHSKVGGLPPFSLIDINHLPAVAPSNVLDRQSISRLQLNQAQIDGNLRRVKQTDFVKRVQEAYLKLAAPKPPTGSLERRLTQVKFSEADLNHRRTVLETPAAELTDLKLPFEEPGLGFLQFLYQARNFPKSLKTDQIMEWEEYRRKLFYKGSPSGLQAFKRQLQQSLQRYREEPETLNILEELQLYIENILPDISAP